ncbi:adenylate/guanylate cyclase domain-containing protein [Desulfospira joergensenii]|uniref:adenylate/guanylate cyclase domain-containing protein n=1 Tax=Desulfospira joergensenii TaxID=53329 RepID=UPI0003B3D912|nr:adenylate/guanylate cyclase domain-containing protein [Desulfospira joergensenii]
MNDDLEHFYNKLQDLVIDQARHLINQSQYTKTLLSSLPVAILATDADGRIQTMNQIAEKILATHLADIKDHPVGSLFPNSPEVTAQIESTLLKGRTHHMRSENLSLNTGEKIVGNLYLHPLKDDEQQICGLLMTIEDRTYIHFLTDAFRRYVPPSVSEIIAKEPARLQLGGEEKELSVLFSDLVGFTTHSERLPPRRIVEILSDYFKEMTDEIFKYEGTLKEYVGDEMMAIFGAPIEQADHAGRACAAALAMSEKARQLRKNWEKNGRPPLYARTGINTGPMLVGNLGSPYRFSYGVLGDQVNLASRLEGLNKIYGTEIIIGENTAGMLDEAFVLRELDYVRVKGRKQAISIYELVSHGEQPRLEKQDEVILYYGAGLDSYRQEKWETAIENFQKVLAYRPDDGPSREMVKRIRSFMEVPPGRDWDGIYEQVNK